MKIHEKIWNNLNESISLKESSYESFEEFYNGIKNSGGLYGFLSDEAHNLPVELLKEIAQDAVYHLENDDIILNDIKERYFEIYESEKLDEKINKDNIEVNKVLANPNAGKNAQRIRDMGYETNADSNGRVYRIRNPKTDKVIYNSDYSRDEKGKVDFKGKLDSTRPEMKKTLGFWDDDYEKVPKSQSIGRNKSGGSLNGNRVYDYEEQLKRREGISKNIKDYKKAVSDREGYKNHLSWKEKDIANTEKKIKDAQDDLNSYKKDVEDTKKSIDNAEARRKEILNNARNNKNKNNSEV